MLRNESANFLLDFLTDFLELMETTEPLESTTEEISETTITNLRDGRQFEGEEKEESPPSHPFLQYFDRLRLIYELDLKILGQLADLLSGVNEEVLPALIESLEPILSLLMTQQQFNNIDLAQIIGYVSQTLQKSTFQASLSAHLGDLDFINLSNI